MERGLLNKNEFNQLNIDKQTEELMKIVSRITYEYKESYIEVSLKNGVQFGFRAAVKPHPGGIPKKERQTYKEEMTICTPGITGVFHFDMLEGSAEAIQVDDQILIPESLARKLFGDEPAVGKRLESSFDLVLGNGIYRVGGVFKDFPKNSVMQNQIYVSMGDFGKDEWGSNNASFYIRLDSPEAAADLMDNFYRYAKDAGKYQHRGL